jgi:hypothetical protein
MPGLFFLRGSEIAGRLPLPSLGKGTAPASPDPRAWWRSDASAQSEARAELPGALNVHLRSGGGLAPSWSRSPFPKEGSGSLPAISVAREKVASHGPSENCGSGAIISVRRGRSRGEGRSSETCGRLRGAFRRRCIGAFRGAGRCSRGRGAVLR